VRVHAPGRVDTHAAGGGSLGPLAAGAGDDVGAWRPVRVPGPGKGSGWGGARAGRAGAPASSARGSSGSSPTRVQRAAAGGVGRGLDTGAATTQSPRWMKSASTFSGNCTSAFMGPVVARGTRRTWSGRGSGRRSAPRSAPRPVRLEEVGAGACTAPPASSGKRFRSTWQGGAARLGEVLGVVVARRAGLHGGALATASPASGSSRWHVAHSPPSPWAVGGVREGEGRLLGARRHRQLGDGRRGSWSRRRTWPAA